MRIRSTKPEFWKSNTIAELSWDERLVLKGLESYVDDNGVGKDDIELIATEVFPRDTFRNPRETIARLTEAISNINRHGLIARYEMDGEKLLYVDKWADIQRVDKPNRGRFRRPDGTLEYSEKVNRESYRNPREDFGNPPEVLAPVTGEQRNRGTEEKKARTPVQTEQHSEPAPTSASAAGPAADLVRANIPKGHPSATLSMLRMQASELLNTGTDPDTVASALRLWCEKPGVGIGRTILSSLCSEVIKTRDALQPQRRNGTDAKGNQWLTGTAQLDAQTQRALEASA